MSLLKQIMIVLSLCLPKFALAKFDCDLNRNGELTLTKDMTIEGEQFPFEYYMGKENFNDSFILRNNCKKIVKDLNKINDIKFNTSWEFSHCRSCVDIERKVFTYTYKDKVLTFRSFFAFPPALNERVADSDSCDSTY